MKLKDRLTRLEAQFGNGDPVQGLFFEIRGYTPEHYELSSGTVKKVIRRKKNEPEANFRTRALAALQASRPSKNGRLAPSIPILLPRPGRLNNLKINQQDEQFAP